MRTHCTSGPVLAMHASGPVSRRRRLSGILLSALSLTACGAGLTSDAPPGGSIPESLTPLTGSEIRYLALQVFQGGPSPAIPFDSVLIYTPRDSIAKVVHDIVTTIGVAGGPRSRLAFVLGPIAFDHTDAEVRRIIDDGFAIALAENVAVGFHIDDAMFWRRRGDLGRDTANVEWTDFAGGSATGLLLDWAHPPARMVFNAPAIRAEVTRRARDVIGAEIARHVAMLQSQGKADLFAGVIAGWESHMGQDVVTKDRVGFHALAKRGLGPGNPPADLGAEIASVVAEFIGLWTAGLAQAGVSPERIYTHVAFLSKGRYAELQERGQVPVGVTYEQVVDAAASSQRPSVAFVANARPGFTTYPHTGVFEQIQDERASHGNPWWASSEGTNIIPGGAAGNSGMNMETYLARSFNHGAALVTIFGWGIGDSTNPYRTVAESADALAAYRKLLTQ